MIFKELSNIISYIKDFFLKVGVRIGIVIRVFRVVEITGVLKITNIIKIRAISNIGSFYARHSKIVL